MNAWQWGVFAVLLPTVAWGHGGRTNAQGCHNDRKNGGYHCHGGSDSSPSMGVSPRSPKTPASVAPPLSPPSSTPRPVRSAPSNEPQITIPSDAKAKFFVLKTGGTRRKPTLTTRRESPSGITYSTREFDCQEQTVRYLGTGETPAAMALSMPEEKMAELVEGSIAWYLWKYACKK